MRQLVLWNSVAWLTAPGERALLGAVHQSDFYGTAPADQSREPRAALPDGTFSGLGVTSEHS